MPPKGAKKGEKGEKSEKGDKGEKPKKKTPQEGEKKGKAKPEEAEEPKCRKELKIPKKPEDYQDDAMDVDEVVGWALHGKVDCDYPDTSKIVRIFTSSTFTGRRIRISIVWLTLYVITLSFTRSNYVSQ